jgi:hypothetical protein
MWSRRISSIGTHQFYLRFRCLCSRVAPHCSLKTSPPRGRWARAITSSSPQGNATASSGRTRNSQQFGSPSTSSDRLSQLHRPIRIWRFQQVEFFGRRLSFTQRIPEEHLDRVALVKAVTRRLLPTRGTQRPGRGAYGNRSVSGALGRMFALSEIFAVSCITP